MNTSSKATRTKRLGLKTAATAAAAALVIASVPASAFAAGVTTTGVTGNSDYNKTGKAVILNESADSWDALYPNTVDEALSGLTTTQNADGSTSYTGVVHSDLAHFSGYGLTTKVTTDARGIVTALDFTSGNDTFAGSWGYKNSAKQVAPIEGFLPDGVTFQMTANADGSYTPSLSGADAYGYQVASSTNRQTRQTTYSVAGYATDGTTATEVTGGAAYDAKANKITVADGSGVNLIKVGWKIGGELTFDTWYAIGGDEQKAAANKYIDAIPATTWDAKPTLAGTMADTNRNRWTYIMASVYAQRMLASWNEALTNEKATGEIEDLDTVSGATKTADSFVSSMNKSVLDGKVKGVAENVKVTIDGSDIDVIANPEDQTTVTQNASGQYVIDNVFPYAGNEEDNGKGESHNIALSAITLYKTGGTPTTAQMKDIAKKTTVVNGGVTTYNGTGDVYTAASLKLNPKTGTGRDGKPTTSYSWGNYDGDEFSLSYTGDSSNTRGITVKDKDVNVVALTFQLGHAYITLAYDLQQMQAAGQVKAQISALSSSSSTSQVKAARTAYNALSTDVRGFVNNIEALEKLEAAAPASKKANTLAVKTSGKTVKLAKVKRKAQTVKPITVSKAKGTVSYKKSSGSAKLSVNKKTGKVTVKKSTKAGTYKAKVKVTAAGTSRYKAGSKTVTVTVKVKK